MADSREPEYPPIGSKPWVAYVGPFSFPWGQAASRRVAGVADSILATGRDVAVISGSEQMGTRLLAVSESGARLWVVGAPDVPVGSDRVARQLAQHVTAARAAVKWLAAQKVAPSHVVVYGGGISYALRILKWARKANVAVLADVVEWYSPRQFRGGIASPAFLSAHIALQAAYPRFDGVIAISEYLRDRYHSVPNAVVPPTMDMRNLIQGRNEREHVSPRSGALTLCYFGRPGRKDLLATIIEGFEIATARIGHDTTLRLRVAGPDEREVTGLLGRHLPPGVDVLPDLPQAEIGEFLKAADFSILLRPRAKFSRAGFPTKFVESLANATPVIANITSDLNRHLVDGVNGLVIAGTAPEDVAFAIERAASLSTNERQRLSHAAHQTAVASFDSSAYVTAIDDLLSRTSH